jgi:hypothetical protein
MEPILLPMGTPKIMHKRTNSSTLLKPTLIILLTSPLGILSDKGNSLSETAVSSQVSIVDMEVPTRTHFILLTKAVCRMRA